MSQNTRRVCLRSDTNRRQSMDRLGDDLCQHLLSFLSLEDRFRCECVSKQWQRVVYKTQTELTINKQLNRKLIAKSFKLMLRKCRNIAKIKFTENERFRTKDFIFKSIIKHCNQLNAICIEIPIDKS